MLVLSGFFFCYGRKLERYKRRAGRILQFDDPLFLFLVDRQKILVNESSKLTLSQLPAKNVILDVVSQILPLQAVLFVVLVMQLLEHFDGFSLRHDQTTFVRRGVDVLRVPNQCNLTDPEFFEDLSSSIGAADGRL